MPCDCVCWQVKDINNLPLAIPQDEYRTDIIALLW